MHRALLPCVATLVLATTTALAQGTVSAVSPVVGAMNMTIQAPTVEGGVRLTTLSVPLNEFLPEAFAGQSSGKITSVTADRIVNTNAAWIPAQFTDPALPYFIRITSTSNPASTALGRTFLIKTTPTVAHTATEVEVDTQGTPLTGLGISAGDTYRIIVGDTLQSFFAGIVGQVIPASGEDGDRVYLLEGQVWRTYLYTGTMWAQRVGSNLANRNNVVLRPDSAILYGRRSATPISFTMLGEVPATPIRALVNNTGTTLLGGFFPVNQTLGTAAYEDKIPGWVVGTPTTGDRLIFLRGVSWSSHFHNATNWTDGSGVANRDSRELPAGTAVLLQRTAGSGSQFVLFNPPYTL